VSGIGTLYARGRRSGIERVVPLRYTVTPGDGVPISAGGRTEQWPLNLRAHPDCQFEIASQRRRYRAVEYAPRSFRLDPV
jgi:hypothetical protein